MNVIVKFHNLEMIPVKHFLVDGNHEQNQCDYADETDSS